MEVQVLSRTQRCMVRLLRRIPPGKDFCPCRVWTLVDRSGPEWPFIPHVFPTTVRVWGTGPQPCLPCDVHRSDVSPVTERDGRASSWVADGPKASVASA